MSKVTQIGTRKADHIRINLEEDVRSGLKTGLEHYRFIHQALPEVNLKDVDLQLTLFNRSLRAPILISSMTGGTEEAAIINQTLAQAAQETGVAMGLGSQRVALVHPETSFSFQVRQFAPDILLFANLGAIQLNYGFGIDQCKKAIEMVGADGLILHLNALQEAVQPEGDTLFEGLLKKIEAICRVLPVPVIAKEVGWGFSERAARWLADAGVAAIDVAGAGGTSWSQVEMFRSKDEKQANLAAAFVDWGIPTAESILNIRKSAPELAIFASGGLRTGIDIAKSIALGASLGGMASPFLKAALVSVQETIDVIEEIRRQIQVCLFAAGVKDLAELKTTPLQYIP
ncbi:MAG: type 2 isopentenyl-diphosphate Delta-isomerase [Chloroflexi bacterium RBG_16_52_11]|nr:MAG: type 2 isopentenyl-diphosphate Delta-isomerase [Chloroflexi bacterium RBG_16_52_11]